MIGCLLDRTRRTISYYKNGAELGVAFRDLQEPRLHPCVGLRTVGEEVEANFGGKPFVADFEALLSAYKGQVRFWGGATQRVVCSLTAGALLKAAVEWLTFMNCPVNAPTVTNPGID